MQGCWARNSSRCCPPHYKWQGKGWGLMLCHLGISHNDRNLYTLAEFTQKQVFWAGSSSRHCSPTRGGGGWGLMLCCTGVSHDNRKLCSYVELTQQWSHWARGSSRHCYLTTSGKGRKGLVLCSLGVSHDNRKLHPPVEFTSGTTGLKVLANIAHLATSDRSGRGGQPYLA